MCMNKYKKVTIVLLEYPSAQEIMSNMYEVEMESTKNLEEFDEMFRN